MNALVVQQTTAGLCAWLATRPELEGKPLVVGYDGRHRSRLFAMAAAATAVSMGRPVVVARVMCPTPIVAYAVRKLGAAAGVMVTASHNPAPDNGFKVYLANGAQLSSPFDAEIAALILAHLTPAALPMPLEESLWANAKLVTELQLDAEYLAASEAALQWRAKSDNAQARPVVYTAMHGVGAALVCVVPCSSLAYRC